MATTSKAKLDGRIMVVVWASNDHQEHLATFECLSLDEAMRLVAIELQTGNLTVFHALYEDDVVDCFDNRL